MVHLQKYRSWEIRAERFGYLKHGAWLQALDEFDIGCEWGGIAHRRRSLIPTIALFNLYFIIYFISNFERLVAIC